MDAASLPTVLMAPASPTSHLAPPSLPSLHLAFKALGKGDPLLQRPADCPGYTPRPASLASFQNREGAPLGTRIPSSPIPCNNGGRGAGNMSQGREKCSTGLATTRGCWRLPQERKCGWGRTISQMLATNEAFPTMASGDSQAHLPPCVGDFLSQRGYGFSIPAVTNHYKLSAVGQHRFAL